MATILGIPTEIPRNEKENYFRMRLLLERATDVLRDVLRTQLQAAYPGLFDPSKTDKLFDVLNNQQAKHTLLLLKKRKVMNSSQMKLLYPSGTPSTTVTTQDLDITLTVVLLRNITNLNPGAKWENPPASDTSLEANIGRVKTYRNNHMHGSPGITDTAFQGEFNGLKHVLLSLSPIYTSDDYDKLLIVPLDAKVAPCQLLSVQLPGKLADLKGRENLVQQIQQHIAGETRLVLLTGMAGIGKTSVAIEVGHRQQKVLFIDMRQVTNLESVKLSLVQHYHPTLSLKDSYGDFQNIFIQTLSSLTLDTVIIFDNNDEVINSNLQEFHNLIQIILNSTKHITLLCTSREAFSLVSHNMADVEVPALDKTSSIDILWEEKTASPTDSESLALGEIAEKCGRNPLALKLLSVQLKRKSVQRLLDRMKNKNVVEILRVANLPASQEMMACLDMSYETLNTEEQKLFRALHIFPVSFHVEEVSEMFEIDEDECESILDSLNTKSLLSADHSGYDFHPLLKSYAAFQARQDQNEISGVQDTYCKYYIKQIALLFSNLIHFPSKEALRKTQNVLPHLKVVADLLSEQLCSKKQHDKETGKCKNLFLIACVYTNVFLFPEALKILETLEMLIEKYFPFEQISIPIYFKIGDVLQKMGKYQKALSYYEKSLEIQKEILDEKHPDTNIGTATIYSGIGSVLGDMGRHSESLTYYLEALDIKKKVHGEKHPDTARTYQDIVGVLHGMGKYAEALTYYKKYLETEKEIGKKDLSTDTYQNIGNALSNTGKYAEALPYYEMSLEIRKEILGEEHPSTGEAYKGIAFSLSHMGKHSEARQHYVKSLEIKKEIFGEKHRHTAATYMNIGNTLRGTGEYPESLTYYEKALKIQKEILGVKHSDTAGTYHNIGGVLSEMGKFADALKNYEKSLEIRKEILGEKHPDTAATYGYIGNTLFEMGKYTKALPYYEKSLKIQKEIFGEKHTYTATAYQNIGSTLCKMGKYAEALPYYNKSLGIFVKHFGPIHSETRDLDSIVRDVERRVFKMVIVNMSKYIATGLIVEGKFGQAGRYLSFINWDFKLHYNF